MEKRIRSRIISKRDTQSNWGSVNPVLLNGEEVLVDYPDGTLRKKVGDGVSHYNDLDFCYFGTISSDDSKQIRYDNIKRILIYGLSYDNKIISDDGTIITSTDSSGFMLTKTFTDNFSTCTSVLKDPDGNIIGRLTKDISDNGSTIRDVSIDIEYDTVSLRNKVSEGLDTIIANEKYYIGDDNIASSIEVESGFMSLTEIEKKVDTIIETEDYYIGGD